MQTPLYSGVFLCIFGVLSRETCLRSYKKQSAAKLLFYGKSGNIVR